MKNEDIFIEEIKKMLSVKNIQKIHKKCPKKYTKNTFKNILKSIFRKKL